MSGRIICPSTGHCKHACRAGRRPSGVGADLGDFGTGYSSPSCLHEFDIEVLKIDRSFIRRMCADRVPSGGIEWKREPDTAV
jgi:predicted signal transduction protein with EAL and GGDEF domain